uniref:Uncharacterized protein n=1 Tax=Anopheles culicifacies TaxID=139723 RepID=A0A182LY72_9DIPT
MPGAAAATGSEWAVLEVVIIFHNWSVFRSGSVAEGLRRRSSNGQDRVSNPIRAAPPYAGLTILLRVHSIPQLVLGKTKNINCGAFFLMPAGAIAIAISKLCNE